MLWLEYQKAVLQSKASGKQGITWSGNTTVAGRKNGVIHDGNHPIKDVGEG